MKNQFQNLNELLEYNFQTILLKYENYTFTITLNRAENFNSLNHYMIEELYIVALYLSEHEKNQKDYYKIKNTKDFELRGIPFIEDFIEIRCILINAIGKNFCSGADLNWLKEGLEKTYDENYDDSSKLVLLLVNLHNISIPIISCVRGFVIGGGVGLLLVSDIVISSNNAKFGISEVTIGVIPAAIIKYLKLKFRERDFRQFLLTGERFDANKALEIGIINFIDNDENIENLTNDYIDKIIKNGPYAVQKVKEMLNFIDKLDEKTYINYVSDMIAKLRQGNESIKGIDAFLSKQKPIF